MGLVGWGEGRGGEGRRCTLAMMCRGVLSIYHVGSRNQTRIIKLDSKHPCLLSHFTGLFEPQMPSILASGPFWSCLIISCEHQMKVIFYIAEHTICSWHATKTFNKEFHRWMHTKVLTEGPQHLHLCACLGCVQPIRWGLSAALCIHCPCPCFCFLPHCLSQSSVLI